MYNSGNAFSVNMYWMGLMIAVNHRRAIFLDYAQKWTHFALVIIDFFTWRWTFFAPAPSKWVSKTRENPVTWYGHTAKLCPKILLYRDTRNL